MIDQEILSATEKIFKKLGMTFHLSTKVVARSSPLLVHASHAHPTCCEEIEEGVLGYSASL